ncbi:SH3 and cysteine-rich domain-containing protein isoform X2 [Oryzias melastigma]|uniref:SH3 and cysteine-rich domain-containing protein isoform X2 n=1 Tax=Oryzias melastigma TaxID=30732 RepID=UPI00168D8E14|nr:SH3 and cysteine-rich domain-containing protein isoform X2 [Oryzias melastigma]
MIPPANAIQDDSGGNEEDQDETPKSPTTSNSQKETKLQRLKRSLSFKTKSIRSKSADNFFRNSSENKTELLSDVSSSTGHLCNIGMAPPHTTNLPIPPVPPAIPCAPPPTSRSQSRNPLQVDSAGHCFMEHIFKKPTFCDVCNHMIVGTTAKHVVFLAGNTAKHGLRCKACKMSLHHKCENGVGQQRCMGKLQNVLVQKSRCVSVPMHLFPSSILVMTVVSSPCREIETAVKNAEPLFHPLKANMISPKQHNEGHGAVSCERHFKPKGFRRYYSSPLLIQEQYGCIKEVLPIACGNKVDPVYEALRFGTSLAQKAKRASGSDSPNRNSISELDKVSEEVLAHSSRQELSRKHSDDVFTVIENGTERYHLTDSKSVDGLPTQLQKDMLKLNTYVALYDYVAQGSHDLEMRAGDRILLVDDSNNDWWKGVIEDRIGFFPSAFALQLRAEDQVFRCTRAFIGCKEQSQLTLKEGQICVGSEIERNGFIRVTSGKKRGYVPCDVLEII